MTQRVQGLENISEPARLLRGFAVDFLTSHNVSAARALMDPAYQLAIGGHVFCGREESYLPATVALIEQFPGLCVTVHDVILSPDAVAMRFTEHGVSRRHHGRAAAWGGIALFLIEDGRLRHGWANEDYLARKRQLATGVCDPVLAPHPCPWDTLVVDPEETALDAARAWLADPAALGHDVAVDEICAGGPRLAELVAIEELDIDVLISAGPRVAFHAHARGRYAGGFPDLARSGPSPVGVSVTGLLTVLDRRVTQAQIAYDRLGLHRRLNDRR